MSGQVTLATTRRNLAELTGTATSALAHMAYLNLLWVGFTLLGVVVLGTFPATVALVRVMKAQSQGSAPVQVARMFLTEYRSSFLIANVRGWMHAVLGILLFVDLLLLNALTGFSFATYVAALLLAVYVSYTILIIPARMRYAARQRSTVKCVLKLVGEHPMRSLLALAATGAACAVLALTPALIPVLAFSGLAWIPTRVFR